MVPSLDDAQLRVFPSTCPKGWLPPHTAEAREVSRHLSSSLKSPWDTAGPVHPSTPSTQHLGYLHFLLLGASGSFMLGHFFVQLFYLERKGSVIPFPRGLQGQGLYASQPQMLIHLTASTPPY